jgi:DNA-binding MarR family transcriptional regulator
MAGDTHPAATTPSAAAPPDVLTGRLGYLFKHAGLRLTEAVAESLAPFGIDGRRLAVLAVLAAGPPLSQSEAAERLAVDRTTMVALVDGLEAQGLVERRRSERDRRRNVLELTPDGRDLLRDAEAARAEAERDFLAPLAAADAAHLVRTLRALIA